jgi:hypothetical protein
VDYSINHYPPLNLLIANFKYTGSDFEKDMKAIGDDEETQRWWRLTDSMQESFNDGASGSGKEIPWWTVSFHCGIGIFASLNNLANRTSRKFSVSREALRHEMLTAIINEIDYLIA